MERAVLFRLAGEDAGDSSGVYFPIIGVVNIAVFSFDPGEREYEFHSHTYKVRPDEGGDIVSVSPYHNPHLHLWAGNLPITITIGSVGAAKVQDAFEEQMKEEKEGARAPAKGD